MSKKRKIASNDQKHNKRIKSNAPVKKSHQTKSNTDSHKSGGQPLIPFAKNDKILFVGEGNFSFSLSCIENHLEHAENVTATCFDSGSECIAKYPEAQANMALIRESCGTVLCSIDATKLHQHFPTSSSAQHTDTSTSNATADLDQNKKKKKDKTVKRRETEKFNVVIFMFPHVAAGIAEQDRNVLTNQKMLLAFFNSVQSLLSPPTSQSDGGTVAVTLATGTTYDLWDLRGLAKKAGLVVKTSARFDGKVFPGYQHRRTTPHKILSTTSTTMADREFTGGKGEERDARWTIFMRVNDQQTQREEKRDASDDDEDDD